MSTPIYDALVAEGFDPATVPPNSTRTQRKVASERWLAATTRKIRATPLTTPKRRPRKKAS